MRILNLPSSSLIIVLLLQAAGPSPIPQPGSRVLHDAHNCYPYDGRWADRIERAINSGMPLAIEQDLYWYTDPRSGKSWSVVSHGSDVTGSEPVMRDYFFEHIRPMMEQALREGDKSNWPLITLNLDFKSEEPEHLGTVWKLLGDYEGWISTAERGSNLDDVRPLDIKPLLVLTGDSDAQQRAFYNLVPVGSRLRVFGAVHTDINHAMDAPSLLMPNHATNYRRWWNNPWRVVERGGQIKAGDWTSEDNVRLQSLVHHAHARKLWIRFYTLNGSTQREMQQNGWDADYNFGSRAAVELRWRAAIEAGVDYIATDQYEDLAAFQNALPHQSVGP